MSHHPKKGVHLPKVRMLNRGSRMGPGLRITNVKSAKSTNSEMTKKQEHEKLRAQVHKEIVSKSRMCAYKNYVCQLPVLTGRQYCFRHILRDSSAPYRQCVYTCSNGKRCMMPSPDDQREGRDAGLCFEHARAAFYARQRSTAPPPPVCTTETLLHQLSHYVKPERHRTTSCASSVSVVSEPSEQDPPSPQAIDPFKHIDAIAVNAGHSASIMECGSASDSDGESVSLGVAGDSRAGAQEELSDAEDAPCEELPLWKAGVYTAEEAVTEAKTALILLQGTYIRQMDRLKTLLQTTRLHYLRTVKAEKEQYCSINSQARSGPLTVRERRQLRKLKAFASYHKKHGVDAVLARKLQHRRARLNDSCTHRPVPSQGRCVFTEGSFRCPLHVMPASKYCRKHILHDRHQVLFAACGDIRGVDSCREPVAKLPMSSGACSYHTDPPGYTVFTLKKDDSGSDTETNSSTETSHSDLADMSTDEPRYHVNNTVSNHVNNHIENHINNHIENHISNHIENHISNHIENHISNHIENHINNHINNYTNNHIGYSSAD